MWLARWFDAVLIWRMRKGSVEAICRQTGYRPPGYLLTLSQAYAASGRRDEAISTGEAARRLANESGAPDLARTIANALSSYREGD